MMIPQRCTVPEPVASFSLFANVCRGDFGPDVSFIDATLDHVFTTHNVDAARCGLAGEALTVERLSLWGVLEHDSPHPAKFFLGFKLMQRWQ